MGLNILTQVCCAGLQVVNVFYSELSERTTEDFVSRSRASPQRVQLRAEPIQKASEFHLSVCRVKL